MEGPIGWTDFLVAAAGATGALVGLVFIGLSINLTRILALPGVSGRAAETVLLLGSALIGSLLALIPGLSRPELGLLLCLVWVPTWGAPTVHQIQHMWQRQFYKFPLALLRFVLYQAATAPMLLAGLSLRQELGSGMLWFALGVLLSLIVSLLNAWVLLIEILR
jgi:hypothetical protein